MKMTRMIPCLLASALLLASLAACSSASSEPGSLAYAEQEIQKEYPEESIPEIDGLELKAAYKEKAFSPSEALAGVGTEKNQERKDSVIFVYADQKGELESKERQESVTSNREPLYGPYSGTSKLMLTLSDLPVQTAGAERLFIDGIEMEVARTEEGSFFAAARSGEVTYTLQADSNSAYEEDELLGILAQVARKKTK